MLLSLIEITISLSIGIIIHLLGFLTRRFNEKLANTLEITSALVALGVVFYQYTFLDSFMYIAFISSGWLAFFSLTEGEAKYRELKEELRSIHVENVKLNRKLSRIFLDFGFAAVVFASAILFLIFGPETSPLKFFIAYTILSAATVMVKRFITYAHVKVCYSKDTETLYILSRFNARKFPTKDLQTVKVESSADILKLHPYFSLFTTNSDFTTSFQQVLRLHFPGETVYLTVNETETWRTTLENNTLSEKVEKPLSILPFYHKKNIKRLLGKLYFAMTVKGISAYTGLLLLLYFLKTPMWLMITFALFYWIFNLYISDRILSIAMDAKETKNSEVIASAKKVFKNAGIPDVKVYETESDQYNGLATGMNIGRSMVTLTTATIKLPIETIEGILAHEAVHVKKRDVMWGQIWNTAFLLIMLGILYLLVENISDLEANAIPLFFVIWFLMILYPVYQSFYSQLMEVRADHLGASFLKGGTVQMAESLTTLANRQDDDSLKNLEYSAAKGENRVKESSLDRSSWWLRILEFQMLPHPPMYWRVKVLTEHGYSWGRTICKHWFIDRHKESFSFKKLRN
ncbi:M56 family metallopeptidase [Aquibacillus saliphilus]|uniref:M56 family metallopeptidase n=1 Tax=Aquibacillus saliphilus TaxID=1909422 RepID=UPI001CEFEB0C|nr:M56 family metallopeptidase [Aquibacillus saliphilus]